MPGERVFIGLIRAYLVFFPFYLVFSLFLACSIFPSSPTPPIKVKDVIDHYWSILTCAHRSKQHEVLDTRADQRIAEMISQRISRTHTVCILKCELSAANIRSPYWTRGRSRTSDKARVGGRGEKETEKPPLPFPTSLCHSSQILYSSNMATECSPLET